jgi:hypothetical protein
MDSIVGVKLPSQDAIGEYLFRLYFGKGSPIDLCVRRAYLDLSRTLHGIRVIPKADILYHAASDTVRELLTGLLEEKSVSDQSAFDDWHRQQCERLIELYASRGYSAFSVGQAQKWLNMGLKYAITLGAVGILPGIDHERFLKIAHAPLDNIFLKALESRGHHPDLELRPWSRIANYDTYFAFQLWLRKEFSDSAPLAVEFELWLKEMSLAPDVLRSE